MVVIEISSNNTTELAFIQSDDMVEAVASQRSDESFHERVLPRTSRCAENLLDRHATKALLKFRAVDCITISKQILWRTASRKGLDDLLRHPLSRRILSNVELQTLRRECPSTINTKSSLNRIVGR